MYCRSSMGANCTASIAFGYPQRIFGVNPKPPRPRKCYNFLKSVHLPLTSWWTLCYPEFAENLCTAPLQLNTQHNRYFTLPVGRTVRSRQTGTRGRGESTMILLLPHASDGVMAFGLESVRSLQGQWTVAASGLPVMFPCLGASGKLDIFFSIYFDVRGFFYYLHNRVIDAITRIIWFLLNSHQDLWGKCTLTPGYNRENIERARRALPNR